MTNTAHENEKGHSHSHGASPDANTRLLSIALALMVGFLIVEVVVAIISGSLALLSDAGHMLTDAAALAGSLVAIRLAARPSSSRWTFGLKRAEILSAAVNGITLVVISAIVAVEAIRRLLDPPEVEGGPVLIVALLGVAVNIVAVWVLAKANRQSLNVEGSFQHILTDLYGFIATVVAGIVILFTGFTRADSIASLIVVVLMLHAAWGLLRDSGRILLEGTPEGIDLDTIRGHLMEPDHVLTVHDLHVWTVTSDLPALSAHVTLTDECFHDGHAPRVLDELQACLVGHFDVEHSTFQLEPAAHAAHESETDHA
ncbi:MULTISPECIES: cation diffusion facilitator family transporter [unclassified Frondihabitans]|uniref:cation diffusion facilitator family transporter n=1 Tax=unclassified Frondihabitans TaxID=2626248 RepID=UPI000F972DDB|nr:MULTISPECIES: cation diffusion facilitator family transporter [unclassified Frondihabitans]RPE73725.1 cobalt-zinc-cadmium efflux system protein [Frondihabitans sp. PhB153]RPF02138.1 cobalt-zinc-cadmium efflux system protein [Frondihabitans sp. PhB161]